MNRIIKAFYIVAVGVALVVALGMLLEFRSMETIIRNEMEAANRLQRDLISSRISAQLQLRGKVIENAAAYIAGEEDDQRILKYFKALMESNPTFTSIYFGTPDNVMINGSGWVPPATFDLRTRPWYLKASQGTRRIYTEAFLNATRDRLIVTVAMPVYREGVLKGVVAGDIGLENILGIVRESRGSENGYTMLVDSQGNLLAHPNYNTGPSAEAPINVSALSEQLASALNQGGAGALTLQLEGVDGYMTYDSVPETDWMVGSFIPAGEYLYETEQMLRFFLMTAAAAALMLYVLLRVQKHLVLMPILALDNDIRRISAERDLGYRLPVQAGDPFLMLRESVNSALEKTESFFKQSEAQRAQLAAANAELESSVRRIEYLSYHDQLTGLYNRRFFEAELQRLDTGRNLPFSLAMADVNGLKLTNDAFGHAAGDQLLISVGEIFARECRADEIIARIGGDEFVILFPKTSEQDAKAIIRRIQKAIESVETDKIVLSVSMGLGTKTSADQPIHEVLIRAEENMYRKKLVESQSMRNETIRVILKTLGEKSAREKEHSINVSRITRKIGQALELDRETMGELEAASLMHDIGKIAVSEAILNKAGPLTVPEREEMRKHPEVGYQVLKSADAYTALAEIVLSHHERWDGSGYPRGLKGADVPYLARIIAVADALETMTTGHRGRSAMDAQSAAAELERCAGTQFDPEIVAVAVRLLQQQKE